MTRETAYLILKELVLESTEFNGDMYPEGHGDDFIAELKKCKDRQDFERFINDFNEENFQYPEQLIYEVKPETFFNKIKEKEMVIDFNDKYFDRFFSDWVFFKNLSDTPVKFITRDDEKIQIILNPNETFRFNFRRLE